MNYKPTNRLAAEHEAVERHFNEVDSVLGVLEQSGCVTPEKRWDVCELLGSGSRMEAVSDATSVPRMKVLEIAEEEEQLIGKLARVIGICGLRALKESAMVRWRS